MQDWFPSGREIITPAIGVVVGGMITWVLQALLRRARIEVRPNVEGEYALLEVTNLSLSRAVFRAEGKIVRGSRDRERAYSIRWRESDDAEVTLNGRGGHQTLNVASASTGLLPGQRPTDLRYREFTFHTARIPVGQSDFSQSFQRWQDNDDGFVVRVAITSDPPLRREFKRYYRLRAAEDPDTVSVSELTEEALNEALRKAPSPKIELEEIAFDEESD